MTCETIITKLRDIRVAKRISQDAIAVAIGQPGTRGSYISSLEVGKKIPRLDTIIKVADVLGYDLLPVPRGHAPKEDPTITAQRAKIEELEETIEQMREKHIQQVAHFPTRWRLTPTQNRLLVAFAKSPDGFASHEHLARASGTAATNIENLVKVQITKLRQAVHHLGIKIENRWGEGYQVTSASHAFIKSVLNGEAE